MRWPGSVSETVSLCDRVEDECVSVSNCVGGTQPVGNTHPYKWNPHSAPHKLARVCGALQCEVRVRTHGELPCADMAMAIGAAGGGASDRSRSN